MGRNDKHYFRGDGFVPEGRAGEPKRFGGVRYWHVWYTCREYESNCEPKPNNRSGVILFEKLIKAGKITSRRSPKTVLYGRVEYVYYKDGVFYTTKTQKNTERKGDYAKIMPLDGTIWTCYPQWQAKRGIPDAKIRLAEGVPVSVNVGGEEFAVTPESWPTMESFLGLDMAWKPARYRRPA